MGDPRKRVRDVGKRDPGGEGPKEKARPEARQDAASSLRSPAPPGRAEGGGGGGAAPAAGARALARRAPPCAVV